VDIVVRAVRTVGQTWLWSSWAGRAVLIETEMLRLHVAGAGHGKLTGGGHVDHEFDQLAVDAGGGGAGGHPIAVFEVLTG
jgi:hypothetical protein